MLIYWIIVILLGILLFIDLRGAFKSIKEKTQQTRLVLHVILDLVLLIVIFNALARLLEWGVEVPLLP